MELGLLLLAVWVGIAACGTRSPVFQRDFRRLQRGYKPHETRTIAVVLGGALLLAATARIPFLSANFEGQAVARALLWPFLPMIFSFVAAARAAYGIVKEREQRTLQEMLTTDLSAWEIVIGSYLGAIVPFVVEGILILPLLGLAVATDLFDWETALRLPILTVANLMGFAGLATLISCRSPRTRDATVAWVKVILLLLMTPTMLFFLRDLFEQYPGGEAWRIGHDIVAMWQDLSVALILPNLLTSSNVGWYLAGHGLLASVSLGWATATLRSVDRPVVARSPARRFGPTPRVWDHPLLWKEVCLPATLGKFRWGICLIGGLGIGFIASLMTMGNDRELRYLELIHVGLGCASLMVVGLGAATSLCVEREHKAWELLKLTDLTPREIILAMLGGGISTARYLVALLAVAWIGLVVMNPRLLLTLPLGIGSWMILAFFYASVGVYSTQPKQSVLESQFGVVALGCLFGGWNLFLPIAPLGGFRGPFVPSLLVAPWSASSAMSWPWWLLGHALYIAIAIAMLRSSITGLSDKVTRPRPPAEIPLRSELPEA